MTVQAFFDDSKQDGQALIYAGYLASSETWSQFIREWGALLSLEPGMDAFKMRKIARGNIQRAKPFYEVISRLPIYGIGCAIPIAPLKRVVDDMGLNPSWANPYLLAWRSVLTLTLEGVKMLGADVPVEFVFDNQTEKEYVMKGWKYFHGSARRSVRKKILGPPSFRDDKDTTPLQAADLLAWWARKQYLRDKLNMKELFPDDWTNGNAPHLLFADVPEDSIRKQFSKDVEVFRCHEWQENLRASLKDHL